ncbi:MAG: T9SS type A sorting domain-containing protein [Bacteroidetes bacterium]|nr:T9SS type A sorting domain-containing protein [Bacteroidota bacterium]
MNDAIAPAFPATCTVPSLNGPFSLATVSGVTAPSAGLAYAPCAYAQAAPPPSAPPNDIWFRMDLPSADAVYRFTLIGSATPGPAMVKGGMAVYEAPNAGGPFRLLDCSNGGSLTNTLPTVEASCITAGNKLYVRVWDRSSPSVNSSFTICVRGQRSTLMPDRGADETPCAARTIAAVGAFSLATTSPPVINYVYACDEAGFLPTTPEKNGGDLWVKLQVPNTGQVIIKASFGTAPNSMIGSGNPVVGSFGVSAYLASNCSDYNTFREVGSVVTLVTPSGTTAASANLNISCMPDGAWLYVRLYALKEATSGTKVKRFGQVRFEWMAGPLPYPGWTPANRPANSDPCGAVDLVVDAACTGAMVSGGNSSGACNTPGIPAPSCGGYNSGTASVWHKFVAPGSGIVQIDAKAAGPAPVNPAIALYTSNNQGCGGRMALIACDDRQGPGSAARIIKFGLVPGQTYYIRTWGMSADGTFSLCVSQPTAPAGSCLYMIDLFAKSSTGSQAMTVSINGGPITTYTTSGGDPSETFLVAIPAGATADFRFLDPPPVGFLGYYYWALWQVGNPNVLWWDDGGYSVFGGTGPPQYTYHISSACSPFHFPSTDCRGMRTVCLSTPGTYHTVNGTIVNYPRPRNPRTGTSGLYGSTDYTGYTYDVPNGNDYDLAGANMGCLSPEKNGIEWLVFRPNANGTLAFLFDANKAQPIATGPVDLDFGVWDLGPMVYTPGADTINGDLVCPPRTAPVRCSSAHYRGSTGLVEGMSGTYEGPGGWGWLAPLPVLNNHGYLIALQPVDTMGEINYSMSWTLYKNALGVIDPSIITCTNLVLPVELLFLAGLPNGSVVDLSWATATEKNSSRFVVERSTNNLDFAPIGQVRAAGNSQYRIDYGFTDPAPVHGVNYYRLRLVDLDGSYETSNVIAVEFTGTGSGLSVWPNPVQELLHIGVDLHGQAAVTVQVLDALGRMVQQQHVAAGSSQASLEVGTATLVPGAYMVRILGSGGGLIGTARFVKAKP